MKRISLIVTLTLFFVSPAFAVTGKAYLEHCSNLESNSIEFIRCSSYTVGVVDNMRGNKAGNVGFQGICIPQKTNDAELVNMTVKWLQTNQDALHMWAAFGVTMAMSENYPCGCDSNEETSVPVADDKTPAN
jgi:hypothetical protein